MRVSSKNVVKLLSMLIVLCVAFFVLTTFDINEENYQAFVNNHLQNLSFIDKIIYILSVGFFTSFAIPRQILSLIGGFVFGPLLGTIFTTLGAIIGCMLVFSYGRYIGQDFVQRKFSKQIKFMEKILSINTFAMTLAIRLLPFGAGIFTNLVTGTSKINARKFFMGTFIGYIPQNFIFALLGSGFHMDNYTRITISISLLLCSMTIGYFLYRKYFYNNQLNQNLI